MTDEHEGSSGSRSDPPSGRPIWTPDQAASPEAPGADAQRPAEPAPASASPTERYTPEPAGRPAWQRPWETDPRPTPEAWFEASTPATTPPARPTERRGSGTAAVVLAAAVIGATLASGGTYLALSASGALDRPVVSSAAPAATATGTRQAVSIDESSAVIDVAAKVNPAVVQITS
ncbi:MAG TPA: hypothetical protein VIV06_07510, partial [Candidatus Limnocylindrales bacterium]